MNEVIGKALKRVGLLEGVHADNNPDDDLCIGGSHFNDYVLAWYLGKLLECGEMKIEVNPPERMDYVKKLMGVV